MESSKQFFLLILFCLFGCSQFSDSGTGELNLGSLHCDVDINSYPRLQEEYLAKENLSREIALVNFQQAFTNVVLAEGCSDWTEDLILGISNKCEENSTLEATDANLSNAVTVFEVFRPNFESFLASFNSSFSPEGTTDIGQFTGAQVRSCDYEICDFKKRGVFYLPNLQQQYFSGIAVLGSFLEFYITDGKIVRIYTNWRTGYPIPDPDEINIEYEQAIETALDYSFYNVDLYSEPGFTETVLTIDDVTGADIVIVPTYSKDCTELYPTARLMWKINFSGVNSYRNILVDAIDGKVVSYFGE